VEQRHEPHVKCYQSAQLTLLSGDGGTMPAHIIHLCGFEMRIVVQEPVPTDIAASIQVGDWMAFGEVTHCEREHAHYAVRLELDQVVTGLLEIDALRRNRLNERSETQDGP
jgi:hypothetical protein